MIETGWTKISIVFRKDLGRKMLPVPTMPRRSASIQNGCLVLMKTVSLGRACAASRSRSSYAPPTLTSKRVPQPFALLASNFPSSRLYIHICCPQCH
eukprot:4387512-Pleurochrysis_carterae.AAC.1